LTEPAGIVARRSPTPMAAIAVESETNQSRHPPLADQRMSASAAPEAAAAAATITSETGTPEARTPLLDKWVLYAHLPNDTAWTLDSYRRVLGFNALEEGVALARSLPDITVKRCMLFLMRSHVEPRWEDALNRDGGCFSFKVANKQVVQGWRNLMYSAMGESIFESDVLSKHVTGITISPKKSFSIIKVWLQDCKNQDPTTMNQIPGLLQEGCLFKRHIT
jgi:hypothetical protein